MRAFTLRPKKHAEVRQAFPRPGQEDLACALAKHFKESTPVMEACRVQASPATLPEAAEAEVSRGRRERQRLGPLPFLAPGRTVTTAPSSLAEGFHAWARSEKGVMWIAERRRLWTAALAVPEEEETERGLLCRRGTPFSNYQNNVDLTT